MVTLLSMRIGHHQLTNCLIAAPMAGITDRPFRTLCHAMGAGLGIRNAPPTRRCGGRISRVCVWCIAMNRGSAPCRLPDAILMMAAAAYQRGQRRADHRHQYGMPCQKVNWKLAGSALLQYPDLVKRILHAVVDAVDVPVTLKIRTGWAPEHRNCVEIAQLAEDCGIQALTIHGRTRACLFNGDAEYDSIRAVKQSVSIPIIANGDITDPHKARAVLDYTGADALMIGRAAQGDPDLPGNPALSGHWRAAAAAAAWRGEALVDWAHSGIARLLWPRQGIPDCS